jgi:hypothetical protein
MTGQVDPGMREVEDRKRGEGRYHRHTVSITESGSVT